MCFGRGCSREWENGGTCRDPRKCEYDEQETERQAALGEVDDLRDALKKNIAAMTSEAEHVARCSVFAEVRSMAERMNEALECLIDEFQGALRDAHASLGE